MSTTEGNDMGTNGTALAPRENHYGLDVRRVVDQTLAIQQLMKSVLKEAKYDKDGQIIEDGHYGIVPGTKKRTLFQSGADKLCLLFRLRPSYTFVMVERDDFISNRVRCRLRHIVTGELWGEGWGSANSREEKYRRQSNDKVCPKCNAPAIIRGKPEFGGGWICWKSKNGCGAKFADDAREITDQVGLINSDKVHNLSNTILKIGCKRAKVAGVLCATAASDLFTQDLEDLEDLLDGGAPPAAEPAQEAGSAAAPSQPKPATNGNGKKATPIHVRDLNFALGERTIAADERLGWVSGMVGREVKNLTDLPADEIERLIADAKAGKSPQGWQ